MKKVATYVLFLAVVVSTMASGFAQTSPTDTIVELITSSRLESDDDAWEILSHALVDAGAAALPALEQLAQQSNGEQKFRALAMMAFVGGDSAASIIRKEYDKGETETKPILAMALGSADTPENRALLVEMLTEPTSDDGVIQAAALSAGILRVNEATDRLRMLLREKPNADYVELALTWIQNGYAAVNPIPNDDRQLVIAAVLKNGLPYTDQYHADETGQGYWTNTSNGWTFTSTKPPVSSKYSSELTSYIGTGGTRALVSVVMFCGMRCGYRYDYFLGKQGSEWKVQTMSLIWIS